MEDKFGRRRPMFLPIYHGQTCCRISIERLAMRKGSLICVPSLRRLCFLGASFKLGFMPVSRRSTAKLFFHLQLVADCQKVWPLSAKRLAAVMKWRQSSLLAAPPDFASGRGYGEC